MQRMHGTRILKQLLQHKPRKELSWIPRKRWILIIGSRSFTSEFKEKKRDKENKLFMGFPFTTKYGTDLFKSRWACI
jgi:hypothetical protein